jgi:hypothetical protein
MLKVGVVTYSRQSWIVAVSGNSQFLIKQYLDDGYVIKRSEGDWRTTTATTMRHLKKADENFPLLRHFNSAAKEPQETLFIEIKGAYFAELAKPTNRSPLDHEDIWAAYEVLISPSSYKSRKGKSRLLA